MAAAELICVSHFAVCECDLPSVPELHLSISTAFEPLQRGKAVAISYTWGAFSRRQRVIGHDHEGKLISIEVGAEWASPSLDNFITTLASLHEPREDGMHAPYVWLDQLNHKKEDSSAEVRVTLSRIPDIYRTLDTVALMPGGPCECKIQQLEALENEKSQLGSGPVSPLDPNIPTSRSQCCINNLGFATYFQRLWTRQEHLYAKRYRAQWTSPQILRCDKDLTFEVLDKADPSAWRHRLEELNVTSKLHLERYLQDRDEVTAMLLLTLRSPTYSLEDPLTKYQLHEVLEHIGGASARLTELSYLAQEAWNGAKQAALEWQELHLAVENPDERRDYNSSDRNALRLLCGRILDANSSTDSDSCDYTDQSDHQKLQHFAQTLISLQEAPRAATVARDYVLAVWVDCPRYQIPVDYTSMTATELLEDALIQLEQNFGQVFISTLPAGLFSNSPNSWRWQPSLFQNLANASNSRDVYDSLYDTLRNRFQNVHQTSVLPLYSPHGPGTPRVCIESLHEIFQNIRVDFVLRFLLNIIRSWSPLTKTKLRRNIKLGGTYSTTWMANSETKTAFYRAIGLCLNAETTDGDFDAAQIGFQFTRQDGQPADEDALLPTSPGMAQRVEDIFEVFYNVVCMALGVNPSVASQAGLKLMARRGFINNIAPLSVGLVKQTIPLSPPVVTVTVPAGNLVPTDAGFKVNTRGLFYELFSDRTSDVAMHGQVIGVWVPVDVDNTDAAVLGADGSLRIHPLY